MRKSWESHAKIMRKTCERYETVMRQCTPVAYFADMFILVCFEIITNNPPRWPPDHGLPFRQRQWKNPAYGRKKHLSTDADSTTDTKKIMLVRQNWSKKKLFLRDNFTPFMHKSIHIWNYLFPLVFPEDLENLKSLDIGLQEVGAKYV